MSDYTRVYNLKVKTRSYTDRDGKEKGVYVEVGAVYREESTGRLFQYIEPYIDFAGFPRSKNGSVAVNMFEANSNYYQNNNGNNSSANGNDYSAWNGESFEQDPSKMPF